MARMDVNIFTQIGFVVLVGLACKNAILIVEFAKAQREAGVSIRDATLEACKLRLRPIIMTSFAFVLGTVPLAIATGVLRLAGYACFDRLMNLQKVSRAFELKAVSFLGHRPELYQCVECGREDTDGFSPRRGGVICSACEDEVHDVLSLPKWTRGLLRRLTGAIPFRALVMLAKMSPRSHVRS
jgi:hypothetical protein